MKLKELAVGKEKVIKGVKVKCIERISGDIPDCNRCAFNGKQDCSSKSYACMACERSDHKEVYFQEVK